MRNWFGFRSKVWYPTATFNFGGVEYRWSGWYGCQLESYEWTRKPAGTQRLLKFHVGTDAIEMTLFTTRRKGLMVNHTWAVNSDCDHKVHSDRIYKLQDQLRKLV